MCSKQVSKTCSEHVFQILLHVDPDTCEGGFCEPTVVLNVHGGRSGGGSGVVCGWLGFVRGGSGLGQQAIWVTREVPQGIRRCYAEIRPPNQISQPLIFVFVLRAAQRITTEIWDKSLNRAGVREGIRPHRKRNTQKSAKQNSSQKWVYAGYTRAYAQGIREVYARVTWP